MQKRFGIPLLPSVKYCKESASKKDTYGKSSCRYFCCTIRKVVSVNIFDIIGSIMVGPSSSHTVGAVKIGYVARKLLAELVAGAEILLYGSFLATGKGYGTHLAVVAGLLGMEPDDDRIPCSLKLEKGFFIVNIILSFDNVFDKITDKRKSFYYRRMSEIWKI